MSPVIQTALILMTTFTASSRAELRENIEYGQAAGVSLRLDARIPEGSGPFAGAIIVHGGAWVSGDRHWSVLPLFRPLTEAHIATFSISYRLANHGRDGFAMPANLSQVLNLGTAVDDVRQAIAYVKSHAAEYRIDPDRIALIGESAGAQLASMAALHPAPNGDVRAVVAFYGPSDLVKLAQTSVWIPDVIRQSLNGTPLETMLFAGLRELSPVTWVSKKAPPFLLIHGTADTLVPFEQSLELCARLQSDNVNCEVYPVHDGHHGIRWWESVGLTDYKAHMVAWLARQLK
jgi:acetyl esterase